MSAPTQDRPHAGARRDRFRYDDPFERRLAAFESATAEYARDMRHRGRQAARVVTAKKSKFKQKKVRTSVGMAGRVAGVGAAGTYLAARNTVRTSRRAYKAASPHVRRVAGHAARAAHSYATVYGQHYATTARRKALRTVARHRVAGRQRRHLRSDPVAHAARVANGRMSTRSMRTARKAARLLDPDSGRTTPRPRRVAGTPTPAANKRQDKFAKNRAASIRRDPHQPHPYQEGEEPLLRKLYSTHESAPPSRVRNEANRRRQQERAGKTAPQQGGTTVASNPGIGSGSGSTNPSHVMQQGFKLAGDFNPVNFTDWMQQLRGMASAFRTGQESFLRLAMFMDLQRRMDPRALTGLYVIAVALGQSADVMLATANEFWRLYSDRMENSGRGRTMTGEEQFFGQQ